MKNEISTRKVTTEEAKKYGIKTVLDEIEWFTDGNLPTNPTIGLNAAGLHLNRRASEELGCNVGSCLKIGFNPGLTRLIITRENNGVKLRKAYGDNGSLSVINKRLADWLNQKRVEKKRYVLQHDETTEVHYIQLDISQATG
ncbi:hypothetical protein D3C71_1714040 [compost metagenome]